MGEVFELNLFSFDTCVFILLSRERCIFKLINHHFVLPALVSIANDVACRSLDWLEASFPVIQSPTDQVTIKTPHTIATEPTELTPPHVTGRRLSQNQDA